jgi:recombination protein RecA
MAQTALQQLLSTHRVRRASALQGAAPVSSSWSLGELSGRLVELSGEAALTVATGLVLQAQRAGEPTAWIARAATFFPPDVVESGVDLAALAVVLPERSTPPGAHEPVRGAHRLRVVRQLRAAEQLLRSGAFGLVVLDLGPVVDLSLQVQTRLASLAQRHDSALLCLTEKDESAPSLGSLVSLHVAVRRRQLPDGRFRCELRALKDKRRGPGWVAAEVCRGPVGLR